MTCDSPRGPDTKTVSGGVSASGATVGAAASRRLGREFGKLWTASSTSAIGDGISLTAAPLIASTLTDDPRLIAGVTMALTLPYALFGIPAGVLADRVDLRRSMARIDFFRGAMVLVFALSVAFDWASLGVMYGCFFLIGTCETFFRNASQILVPSVVAEEQLVDANGRLLGAQTAANQFVGPLVGSALFVLAPAVPFGLDAVTFFVSAVLLTRLRTTTPHDHVTPAKRPGLLADMTTGARWLMRHRLLRNLSLTAGAINLVYTGSLAVLVVYAHKVLGLGDLGYGVLLACQAIGAVAAAKLSPLLVRRIGGEWTLVCVVATMAVGDAVIWQTSTVWVVGCALALGACASITWDVVVVVLRQTVIPKPLQGRVNSIYRLFAWGAMPVGAGLAGVVSKGLGATAVYGLGAAVMAVVAVRLVLGARRHWFADAQAQQS
ncbi:MFS transporter [Streptomyces sp. NPDC048644]|uniref:MFS transporter n=1 Tax=Streptomyces sp. NPDC048644 TaxID=3365582 RepID=UPI0037170A9E